MSQPDFSIVVPLYNSAPYLEAIIRNVERCFNSLNRTYEIFLIDDASTDYTNQIVKQFNTCSNETVHYIQLEHNIGQYGATIQGLQLATGCYVITMDADHGLYFEQLFTAVANHIGKADLIYAVFHEKNKPLLRTTAAWLFDKYLKLRVNKQIQSRGSSFRVLSRPLTQQAVARYRMGDALDVLLINTASKILEVHAPEVPYATSSYKMGSFLKLLFRWPRKRKPSGDKTDFI